jgi:DNA-binding NtrC family response regulator
MPQPPGRGTATTMRPRILVVDDDTPFVGQHLKLILGDDGYDVEIQGDSRTALERLRTRQFGLLITDYKMPGINGMDLLSTVRAEKLPCGVILLTGYGDTELVRAVMKAGADDFVTKPFEPDRLRMIVRRTLDQRRLIDELEQLRQDLAQEYHFHDMVSKSPKMRRVFDLIKQVGPVGSTVLIQGETGTGKELVARAIHASDTRRKGPFVALNCAALNESLLENELFGHEKGAFTGADRLKKGRFEMANGGTLFLDEIGEISPAMQAKLLRVLQTGTFDRVGGGEVSVDVRIVAATNKRLEDEVKGGRFRQDLFYRIAVIRVELPPLRERVEDIPLLAMYFLEQSAGKSIPAVTEIQAEAMQALLEYRWPGNIRELQNAIRGAVAMADGSSLHRDSLPPTVAPRRERSVAATSNFIDIDRPLRELTGDLVSRVERDYFARLLVRFKGNVAKTAKHSALSRRSVTQKLQKYEIDRTKFKRLDDA